MRNHALPESDTGRWMGAFGRVSSHLRFLLSRFAHHTQGNRRRWRDADAADSRPRYVILNEPTFRLQVGPSSIAALLFSHPSVVAYRAAPTWSWLYILPCHSSFTGISSSLFLQPYTLQVWLLCCVQRFEGCRHAYHQLPPLYLFSITACSKIQ